MPPRSLHLAVASIALIVAGTAHAGAVLDRIKAKGTTPLKSIEAANREGLLRIEILEAPDHARGVEMVERGEADRFAMDNVLLYGLVSGRPNPAALKVVGKFLTIEPLAILMSKEHSAEPADEPSAQGFLEVPHGPGSRLTAPGCPPACGRIRGSE